MVKVWKEKVLVGDYEYYHEISLTPLLGMFKCGNFPLDRHNDMI